MLQLMTTRLEKMVEKAAGHLNEEIGVLLDYYVYDGRTKLDHVTRSGYKDL